jgi:hypothetical protein
MGPKRYPEMTHIEEEKVTTTTTSEHENLPKEPVKNINLNVNTDNDGETVTVDEPTVETTEETQPHVNVNVSR